jgi:hypothetical protein
VVHTAVDGSSEVLCLQPHIHSEKAAVRAVACDSTDVAGQGGDEQGWEYDDLKHALRHSSSGTCEGSRFIPWLHSLAPFLLLLRFTRLRLCIDMLHYSGLCLDIEWCHDHLCNDEHTQLYKCDGGTSSERGSSEGSHGNQKFHFQWDGDVDGSTEGRSTTARSGARSGVIIADINGHCLGVCA